MGCFLACFRGAKERKQRRRTKKPLPIRRADQNYHALQASPNPQKSIIKEPDVSVPELRENQEQASLSSCRKKVTFDLNVKAYEDEEDKEKVSKETTAQEIEGQISHGSSYRYQNCENSDDDEEWEGSEFDDEDDEIDIVETEEESYESYFSLPMDKEKQQQNCEEVDSPVPLSVLVKGSARDRSQYVHPVLNPVENLSQWKEVKMRPQPLMNPNKENIIPESETKVMRFSPEATFKTNNPQKQNHTEEISVDASLSTWLVSSENSVKDEGSPGINSQWSHSSMSREDQPILGALTAEDLKLSSVTSSPRRSPIRNPDETPILGTVGSYWNR